MKYILKEIRKLIVMILLMLMITWQYGFWNNVLFVGTLLLFEHILTYGRFDFFDFLGHEWLGLILVLIPLLLFQKWIYMIFIILIFLIGCRYSWNDKLSPLQYAKNKIKYIFKRK